MDYTEITNLISTIGFPIVCCIVMYKQNVELTKYMQEQNNKLTSAIHDMSITLEKMRDKLDSIITERGCE